jgi:branched-chain amino acid transport system permease protein
MLPTPRPLFARSERKSPWWRRSLTVIGLLALLAAPFPLALFDLAVWTRILLVVGIYGVMALGLNIVVGYAGMLDFGRIAFYAIGAYTAMLVGLPIARALHEPLGGASFLVALPISGVVAAGFGLLLGLPMLRLRGDYLTIVTLGFGEIVRICATNNIWGLTNGTNGLPATGETLPSPIGLDSLAKSTYYRTGDRVFVFDASVYWYLVTMLVLFLVVVVVRRQDHSRLGRMWAAMREDDIAASAMGVNVAAAKQYAFALGGFWGGVAGCLFAYSQAFVSPESFTFMESIFVLSIVVIGGMGCIKGVLVGAIIIQGIPELVRWLATSDFLDGVGIHLGSNVASDISAYRNMALAVVMVAMMAFRPEGLIPSKRMAREIAAAKDVVDVDDDVPAAASAASADAADLAGALPEGGPGELGEVGEAGEKP